MSTRVEIATPVDDQPGFVRLPLSRAGLDGTVFVWRSFAGMPAWVQPALMGWSRPAGSAPVQPGGSPSTAGLYGSQTYFAEDYVA